MTETEIYVEDQRSRMQLVSRDVSKALKDHDPRFMKKRMQTSRNNVKLLARRLKSKFDHKDLNSALETMLEHIKKVVENPDPHSVIPKLLRLRDEVRLLAKILNKFYKSLLQLEMDLYFLTNRKKLDNAVFGGEVPES